MANKRIRDLGAIPSVLDTYTLEIDDESTPTGYKTAVSQLKSIFGVSVNETNIIWVGGHGNDSNDGRMTERAKLTFAAATTAASSGDIICCLDKGVYVEDLVSKAGVSIFAPNADIQGNHLITHGVIWKICKNNHTVGSGNRFIINAPVHFKLFLDEMIIPAGAGGYLTAAGSIFDAKVLYQEIGGGFLFVALSAGATSMEFEHIKVTGTATVIAGVITGNISLRGGVIEDTGSGTLISSNSNFHIDATRINMNTLSNIPATATANIICSTMEGTLAEIGVGKANVVSAETIDVEDIISDTLEVGALTYPTTDATAGYVVKTNGAGVLSLQADTFTPVDGIQVYYFGKHGNDSNNGKSWEEAFLTVNAAIVAANTDPLPARAICLDSGTYNFVSTPVILSTTELHMPGATATGALTVEAGSVFKCLEHQGTVYLGSAGAATDYAHVEIDRMPTVASSRIFCDSSSVGSFSLKLGEIAGTSVNVIILATALATTNHYIEIDKLSSGGTSTIGVYVAAGKARLRIRDIVMSGGSSTGVRVDSGAECFYSLIGENTANTKLNNAGTVYVFDGAVPKQVIYEDTSEDPSTDSTTTLMPILTAPTTSDGKKFMSKTFPGGHRIGNIIEVTAKITLASDVGAFVVAALFDSTFALLDSDTFSTSSGGTDSILLKAQFTLTSLASITFDVYGGQTTGGGTAYFNSVAAGKLLGSAQKSWITIKEYQPDS
jgi:hypothetical protein